MKTLVLLSILAIGLAGCSKKEPDPVAVADPNAESAAPAEAPPQGNAQLTQDLNAVQSDLEKAEYDRALETLTAVGLAEKTPAEEQAYQEQMRRTADFLAEKAANDPKVMEYYQRLGRIKKGR